jgi:hypothetical protein
MKKKLLAIGAGLALTTAVVVPAYADSSGSVNATVQVNIPAAPEACITLSTSTLTFDPISALKPQALDAFGTNVRSLQVSNCSSVPVKLSGGVTSATGGSVSWAPGNYNSCIINEYSLSWVANGARSRFTPQVGDLYGGTVPVGDYFGMNIIFDPPCRGSAIPPVGTIMTFTIRFSAVLA